MFIDSDKRYGAWLVATLLNALLLVAPVVAQVFPTVGGDRSHGLKDSIYMVIRGDDAPTLTQTRINVIRNAELGMREFYATGSGGQFDMQFTHVLDVPMALNADDTRPSNWRTLAENYVRNNYSLEPEDFDSNIFDVNATERSEGQGWAGVYYGNTNNFAIQSDIASNFGKIVLDHELGHRVGADHASAFRAIDNDDFTPYAWNDASQQYAVYNSGTHGNVPTPYGVQRDEYGNPFDTMGNISDGAFRVREKLDDLGWLTGAQVPDLNNLGEGTYRIYAHNELELAISTDPDPVYGVVDAYDPNSNYGLTFQRTAERFNENNGAFENYTQRIDLEYRVNANGTGRDGVQFYLDGAILDLDLEGGLTRSNQERELEVGQSIQDIEFGMSVWDAGNNGDGDFLSYNPPAPSNVAQLRGEWFNFDVMTTGMDAIGSFIELMVTTQSFSGTTLVWNQGTGDFGSGFAKGDASQQVAETGVDPFAENGAYKLYLANGGAATLDSSTDMTNGMTVESLRLGTDEASQYIANRNGFGVLTVNDAVSLTIGNGATQVGEVGNLTVAEGGSQGLLTWNSTGTLDVEGKLRVGQGGQGAFIQNDGTVIAGNTGGGGKYIAIGSGPSSDGSNYALNHGTLLIGGGLSGSQLRELRIGSDATAEFRLGDGSGSADTAVLESRWHVFVGHNGGNGTLTIEADGQLVQNGSARLMVGPAASQGTVTQLGGTYQGNDRVAIGSGTAGVGLYTISGGLLDVATDGSGALQVGEIGGNGTFRASGTAAVNAGAELIVADTDSAGTIGRLEIIGSEVSFSVGKLDNALGNDETIRWQADASGVSPLVVRGDLGSSLFVELQHSTEIAATVNGQGDGIALELDLSALVTSSSVLTLIDNQSSEAVQGLFENPSITSDLYEEGDLIVGTGYDGLVSISYLGGTGNDVVLNLLTVSSADFDDDLDVDAADLQIWQSAFGVNALADANADGNSDGIDFLSWQREFTGELNSIATAGTVPEPSSLLLLLVAGGMLASRESRHLP